MGYGAGQLDSVREPRDPDLPVAIDRYECLKKIATGGMAELFLAKQSGLEGFEKVVVLKRILSNLAADEEFVSMFLDEARIAAKLSHPNIVQIYDLGKADDSYYIAMEYVSGRNVQQVIDKEEASGRKIPVEHTCRVIAGVCDGLYYAHSRKDYDGTPLEIVHRDISPQNILVSFAGGVKVVDFGIAKASTQLAQTRAGVLKGKYAYMSPEQVRGSAIDHRADIFALGLVMYEMLTGARAFERDSSLKTLKAIVQEKPLNPRELNPEIPTEVVKLLSRALEKNPDRRYRNAQEMQLAIEDYLDRSARKSNNVRLSKYLYETFDEELASKSGTMIVEGVGEVIVPTGIGDPVEPRIEEEVDSHTLSAALSHEASAADAKLAEEMEDKTRAMPAQSLAGMSELDDSDLDDSDEGPEDKTIPVYDLEGYERERSMRQQSQEAGARQTRDDLEPEDPTNAGDAATHIAHNTSPGDQTPDARANRKVANIEAMAQDESSLPSQNTDEFYPEEMSEDAPTAAIDTRAVMAEMNQDESWEQPTQAVDNIATAGTMPETGPLAPPSQLQSLAPPDALPGPEIAGNLADMTDSVIPSGETIRPAVSIRPAARPGSSPIEVAPGITPSAPPIEPLAVTATTPQPSDLEVTPGTRENPAASPAPGPVAKKPKKGVPMAAILVGGFLFFMIFVSAVSLAAIIFLVPAPTAAGVPDATFQVNSNPTGASVFLDGAPRGVTPAVFQLPQGEGHQLEVKLDGYAIHRETLIAQGTEKLVDIVLKKNP